MKKLNVHLPDALVADIEAEARRRKVSKAQVVRERLGTPSHTRKPPPSLDAIGHLIGSVEGLPPDLSAKTKKY